MTGESHGGVSKLVRETLNDLSDELLKEKFVNGLKEDIHAELQVLEFNSLAQVLDLVQ